MDSSSLGNSGRRHLKKIQPMTVLTAVTTNECYRLEVVNSDTATGQDVLLL